MRVCCVLPLARAWPPSTALLDQAATPASHQPHLLFSYAPPPQTNRGMGSVFRKSFGPTRAALHTSIRRHAPTRPRCRATRAHASGRAVTRSASQLARARVVGSATGVLTCCEKKAVINDIKISGQICLLLVGILHLFGDGARRPPRPRPRVLRELHLRYRHSVSTLAWPLSQPATSRRLRSPLPARQPSAGPGVPSRPSGAPPRPFPRLRAMMPPRHHRVPVAR